MIKSSPVAASLMALSLGVGLCLSSPAFAGPDEDALARIERDFAAMQITKDPAMIERVAAVMDKDFRFTDPANSDAGVPREELLRMVRSGKLVIESMEFRPFTIRISGSTAILEGVNTRRATFEGTDVSGTFAWLDVFEKRDGRWVWLFSQSGMVGEKLADKQLCRRQPCPAVQPGFSVRR